MKKVLILNFLAFFVLVSFASAEFYRYKDMHGNVIFTDDLSTVPEALRPQATVYDDSAAGIATATTGNQPAKASIVREQAAHAIQDLKKEGQRLLMVKTQLDQEYNALVSENTRLKAEQHQAVTPEQIKAVNKKVVGFNTRFQAYQEKSAAYQSQIKAYNQKLRDAESKIESQETPKDP
jgi:Domain of unknown function (DUF4124)